jgi:4-aminobutyrate aminotransferase-like enzyme/Ser/Thr protein kinase RdoA (MazF antagonist)
MSADALLDPSPQLTPEQLHDLLRSTWGLDAGELRRAASERDLTVLVGAGHVLKIAHPAEDADDVRLELRVLAHLGEVDPGLPVPRVVPTLEGTLLHVVEDRLGRRCVARVVTRVSGDPLEGRPITADLAAEVGALAARTCVALQGFHDARAARLVDWDVRRTAELAERSEDARLAALAAEVAPSLHTLIRLPAAVQHADVTLTNVLTDGDEVTGLIDLGDLHHTTAVADLAVTLTSVLRNTATEQVASDTDLVEGVLRGYQRHRPLLHDEVDVLRDLVVARLVLTLAISRLRTPHHADNHAYIGQYDASSVALLDRLVAEGREVTTARWHRLAGTARARSAFAPDSGLLERRRDAMGGRLAPLFYAQPLHVTHGDGVWLHTADGRRLLDAYNNVAVIGHAHPALSQAVSVQLRSLNTHSRYLHHHVVELAERLLSTFPDSLDTALFTTSGTEANELAWRFATEVTGGDGAVIVEHAYHGSSKWFADLSSNEWPTGHRPAAVATFEAPHSRPHAELTRAEGHRRVVDAAGRLLARGHCAALVLLDPAFTSEGILDYPAEFLAGVRDGAHECGALFLADEVQSGYGRSGPQLWRHGLSDVEPDIVTLGKPMGAGYPIGGVVTRRDIADVLARSYEYFSTFAATPAAATAALAVLDVLEERELPQRAPIVGEQLRAELRAVANSVPGIAGIRGTGLIAGVDLVPPDGRDPAEYARAVLESLVERGVLAGVTGARGTVLKVRPPLVWEDQHSLQLAERLHEVLSRV